MKRSSLPWHQRQQHQPGRALGALGPCARRGQRPLAVGRQVESVARAHARRGPAGGAARVDGIQLGPADGGRESLREQHRPTIPGQGIGHRTIEPAEGRRRRGALEHANICAVARPWSTSSLPSGATSRIRSCPGPRSNGRSTAPSLMCMTHSMHSGGDSGSRTPLARSASPAGIQASPLTKAHPCDTCRTCSPSLMKTERPADHASRRPSGENRT